RSHSRNAAAESPRSRADVAAASTSQPIDAFRVAAEHGRSLVAAQLGHPSFGRADDLAIRADLQADWPVGPEQEAAGPKRLDRDTHRRPGLSHRPAPPRRRIEPRTLA